MFQLAEQALEQMRTILSIRKAPREASAAYYIEKEINKFRNQLRNLNFTDVNNGVYNYQTGAMYMDVINECEQLSDCILNVTEARLETNTPSWTEELFPLRLSFYDRQIKATKFVFPH